MDACDHIDRHEGERDALQGGDGEGEGAAVGVHPQARVDLRGAARPEAELVGAEGGALLLVAAVGVRGPAVAGDLGHDGAVGEEGEAGGLGDEEVQRGGLDEAVDEVDDVDRGDVGLPGEGEGEVGELLAREAALVEDEVVEAQLLRGLLREVEEVGGLLLVAVALEQRLHALAARVLVDAGREAAVAQEGPGEAALDEAQPGVALLEQRDGGQRVDLLRRAEARQVHGERAGRRRLQRLQPLLEVLQHDVQHLRAHALRRRQRVARLEAVVRRPEERGAQGPAAPRAVLRQLLRHAGLQVLPLQRGLCEGGLRLGDAQAQVLGEGVQGAQGLAVRLPVLPLEEREAGDEALALGGLLRAARPQQRVLLAQVRQLPAPRRLEHVEAHGALQRVDGRGHGVVLRGARGGERGGGRGEKGGGR